MSRARQGDTHVGPAMIGWAFYPYQVSFGVSVRYWPCLFMPSIRVHVGPFKVWAGISLRRLG